MDTYTDLKSLVQTRLARTDLAARVQEWVTEAEQYFIHEMPDPLRVREMETVDNTLTPTSGVIAQPTGYLEMGELRLADNLDIELFNLPSKILFRYEDATWDEGKGFWSEIGTDIYIRPTPSDAQTYWMKYFKAPLALTDTTQETNTIFPKYSNIYLCGTLWRAYDYIRAADKADRNFAMMTAGVQAANRQYVMTKEGGGALQIAAPIVA